MKRIIDLMILFIAFGALNEIISEQDRLLLNKQQSVIKPENEIKQVDSCFSSPVLTLQDKDSLTLSLSSPVNVSVDGTGTQVYKPEYHYAKTTSLNRTSAFESEEDLMLFARYIKTQQRVFGDDCKAVIVTMFNRFREHNCSWKTYYNTRKINNSRSISLMKKGKLKPIVDLSVKNDSLILDYIVKVDKGETTLEGFENVLYFESYPVSPNKGVHKLSKLKIKLVHKFYEK